MIKKVIKSIRNFNNKYLEPSKHIFSSAEGNTKDFNKGYLKAVLRGGLLGYALDRTFDLCGHNTTPVFTSILPFLEYAHYDLKATYLAKFKEKDKKHFEEYKKQILEGNERTARKIYYDWYMEAEDIFKENSYSQELDDIFIR